VIEGELEVTIDGVTMSRDQAWWRLSRALFATRSKLSPTGRAIIVDHPARPEFG
jgi:hypothetical protein